MRLRNIKDADIYVENSIYSVNDPINYKGKWNTLFDNNNKIEIEIGMGKGDFIISKAKQNPNINYIGFDKYYSVLLSAIKKLELECIPNLKIVCIDALELDTIFDSEIDKIYLNFSDPWPKKRHAKRRLTSPKFLNVYSKIVKDKIEIEMKTDNDDLFEYSLETLKDEKFEVKDIDRDYAENINNLCKTEYEKKFIAKGKNINHLHAVKKI